MKLGTKVTNNLGWHGVVVERPKSFGERKPLFPGGKLNEVVYVDWQEREGMQGGRILSHRLEQLILIQE